MFFKLKNILFNFELKEKDPYIFSFYKSDSVFENGHF